MANFDGQPDPVFPWPPPQWGDLDLPLDLPALGDEPATPPIPDLPVDDGIVISPVEAALADVAQPIPDMSMPRLAQPPVTEVPLEDSFGDWLDRAKQSEPGRVLTDTWNRLTDPATRLRENNYASTGQHVNDLQALRSRDPAAYDQYRLDAEEAYAAKQRELADKRQAEDNQRRRDNERMMIEGRREAQRLTAAAEEEAKNINADGGMKPGFADVAIAVIGGLIQGKTGSTTNMGLEMINRRVEQAVAAQRARLADKRSAAAAAWNRLGDDHAFNEMVRISVYDRMTQEAMTELQQFDPKGTAARQRLDLIDKVQRERALAVQQLDEHNEDRQIKIGEYNLKVADANAKMAKLQGGGGGGGGDVIPRARAAELLGADPGRDLTGRELDKALERIGRATDVRSKQADLVGKQSAAAGLELNSPELGGKLTQKDNSTWRARDVPEAKEVGAALATARDLTDILDEIMAIRDSVGGESSWGNSPDYQRLEVLKNRLVLIKKQGTEGMSSDEDMKRIEKALGAEDPSSFRSQAARLESSRRAVEDELNSRLTHKWNYTGERISFKSRHVPHKETGGERTVRRAEALGKAKTGKESSFQLVGDDGRTPPPDVLRRLADQPTHNTGNNAVHAPYVVDPETGKRYYATSMWK